MFNIFAMHTSVSSTALYYIRTVRHSCVTTLELRMAEAGGTLERADRRSLKCLPQLFLLLTSTHLCVCVRACTYAHTIACSQSQLRWEKTQESKLLPTEQLFVTS